MFESTKELIKQLAYTNEQATKINKKNKKAISQFFKNNYDLIIQIAQNTSSIRYEEYVNQFYVDMPHFNFTTKETLIKSINKSFKLIDCGGICGKYRELENIKISFSLDKSITADSQNTMEQFYGVNYDYIGKLEESKTLRQEEEKYKKLEKYIKKTFKGKKILKTILMEVGC